MMCRCSPEAYAACPTRAFCGPREEATFTEGSECDLFNRTVTDHPMTNADHIRSFSDDDLASELTSAVLSGYQFAGKDLPSKEAIALFGTHSLSSFAFRTWQNTTTKGSDANNRILRSLYPGG